MAIQITSDQLGSLITNVVLGLSGEKRILDDTIAPIFIEKFPDEEDEQAELESEEEEEEYVTDVERAKEDELAKKGNMKKAFEELPKSTQTALENKVAEHNEDVNNAKTKTTTKYRLAVVYWRGIGAYKTNPSSVRPTVTSAAQWAMARVNSFLYVLRNGKFKSGKHDTDLLPKGHPMAGVESSNDEDVDTVFEQFMFDYGGNPEKGDYAKVMKAVGDVDPTNFPKAGDDKAVSLRNSEHELFDRRFAQRIKDEYPEIWDKGGNVIGNDQYRRLIKVLDQDGRIESETDEKAIRLREAWGARHKEDYRIAGVVAQIKWLVVGSRGERYMKDIINDEIEKLEGRTMNSENIQLRCVEHQVLESGASMYRVQGKQRLALNVKDIDVRAFDEDGNEIDVEESLRAIDGRGRPAKFYSIQGVASSTSVDTYGTEMSYSCLMSMQEQFQRGVPLLPRHTSRENGQMAEWDEVFGRTYEADLMQADVLNAVDMNEKQYTLLVRSRLYGEDKLARELVKRLRRGEPIGQSIGGWFSRVDVMENANGEIERVIVQDVQLDHLAITRAPANPDSIGLMTYSKDSTTIKDLITEWRSNMKPTENDVVESVETSDNEQTETVEVAEDVDHVVAMEDRSVTAVDTVTNQAPEKRHICNIIEDESTGEIAITFKKEGHSHDMKEYTKDEMLSVIKEMMSDPETKDTMKEYMKEYLAEYLMEEIENNKMSFDELATSKSTDEVENRELDHTSIIDEPIMDDSDVNGGPAEIAPQPEEIENNPIAEVERMDHAEDEERMDHEEEEDERMDHGDEEKDRMDHPEKRHVMPFNDDLPLAAEDVPWTWNTTTQDEILGEGLDNWERYAMAHLFHVDDANPETKGAYKLPMALMINGELRVVFNGLVAAMGAINGARGGVDMSDEDRREVHNVLSMYYAKFGKEVPELRMYKEDERSQEQEKTHNKQNSVILSQEQPFEGETMNEETMKMFADLIGRSVASAVEPINERLNEIESKKEVAEVEPVAERSTEVEELQAIIAKQNELIERALKEPQRVGLRAGQAHKGIGAVSAIGGLAERAKGQGAVGLSAIVERHIDAISEERSMNDMSVHTIQNLLAAGLRAAEQDGLLGSVDHSWQ